MHHGEIALDGERGTKGSPMLSSTGPCLGTREPREAVGSQRGAGDR